MTDAREALMVARASDGRMVRRPLSPHLQIYRWPLSMATSILHRITGVALAVGTVLLVWWLAAAAASDDAYATVSWFLRSWIGILCLMGFTVALWYHFCNGIRHLVWDAGFGFAKPQINSSSVFVLAAAGVLSLLTWIALFTQL